MFKRFFGKNKRNKNYGRPVITDPVQYIKNTSTFTVDCFNACRNDMHFFHRFFHIKDNPWGVNWSRIVRTYKECGGDVNHYKVYGPRPFVELIIQLNNIYKILTPDLYRELVDCGFTFDGKPVNHISAYGEIGSYGVKDNNDLKIEVMDLICRDFDWLNVVDDRSICIFVFGLNMTFYNDYYPHPYIKVNDKLVRMYLKHDRNGRIKKLWSMIPDNVKHKIDKDIYNTLNKL